MGLQNCWEYVRCGNNRAEGGCGGAGGCPAYHAERFDGLNGGRNGGRICWAVAGTYCEGEVKGVLAEKRSSCRLCGFFRKVEREQGARFAIWPEKARPHAVPAARGDLITAEL